MVKSQEVHVRPVLRSLATAYDATEVIGEDDWIEFFAGELYVIANVVEASSRIRIRVYFHTDEEQVVQKWVRAQPAPSSGLIQAAYLDDPDWRPRLVFERPLADHDWSVDPLFDDVERYLNAWLDDSSIPETSSPQTPYVVVDDPRDHPPSSAWLLKGSEASFPSLSELEDDREAANVGIFTWDWTTAAQTQIGDLALFYFISPRKSAHFVARAASEAFFSRDIAVNADRPVNRAQWWAHFTTPIEIEAIPVDVLRRAAGGYLPLKGRSGLYLTPDTITSLALRAKRPADQAELERVARVPVGRADLPAPQDITRSVWRDLAAGALPLERPMCLPTSSSRYSRTYWQAPV